MSSAKPPRSGGFGAALASASAAPAPKMVPRLPPAPAKAPELDVRSISLTAVEVDFVEDVVRHAKRQLGRKVSFSAALRAIVRHVAQHQGDIPIEQLVAQIYAEIDDGSVVWGERPKRVEAPEIKRGRSAGGE